MRDTVEAFIAGAGMPRSSPATPRSGRSASRTDTSEGPAVIDGRLQGPVQGRPVIRHRSRRRADQHVVRPPDRSAREPHDRRESSPVAATTGSASGVTPRRRRLHGPPHPTTGSSRGPGLGYGDVLGAGPSPLATSATAATSPIVDGLPVPPGSDGTPADLEILGTAPAADFTRTATRPPAAPRTVGARVDRGAAVRRRADPLSSSGSPTVTPCSACRRRRRGMVVTSGTTDWAHGLAGRERRSNRPPRNVLDRLGS